MADTIIQLAAPPGLAVPTLRLFPKGSDVLAGEYPLVQAVNRTHVYTCVVSDALAGDYDVALMNDGVGIGNGVVIGLVDDTEIHYVQPTRVKAAGGLFVKMSDHHYRMTREAA